MVSLLVAYGSTKARARHESQGWDAPGEAWLALGDRALLIRATGSV
jgi:hypothetical protein